MASSFEVQKAIFTVLDADATLIGLGVNVVDFGPSSEDGATIFPYVAVGAIASAEWDTDDTLGIDALARVHCYSDSKSAKQVKDMQGAVYNALHRVSLTVTGYDTILVRWENSDTMRTSRGAYHGVSEFRLYLDAA